MANAIACDIDSRGCHESCGSPHGGTIYRCSGVSTGARLHVTNLSFFVAMLRQQFTNQAERWKFVMTIFRAVLGIAVAVCFLRPGALVNANPGAEKTYYVSPAGNDSWSGTLPEANPAKSDGPFRTLARAQQAMRASTTIRTARLRSGTYSIGSGFFLSEQDSGETWLPYPGEAPVIDGGGTGYITLRGANAITFEELTFENLGLNPAPYPYQIVAFNGVNETIRWNKFVNCRNSCFFAVHLTRSTIDSNVVEGQFPGNPPDDIRHFFAALVLTNGSSDDRITHNLIRHAQGGGIALLSNVFPDQPNNDDLVDRNVLRDVVSDVVDAGAIYVLDRTHTAIGDRVTNNIIDGVGGTGSEKSWTKGLYLDDLTSNVLVSGNICRRGCGEFAVQIHGGDHNRIVNNIFDLSDGSILGLYQDLPKPVGLPWMADNIFTQNIIYSSKAHPQPHPYLWQAILQDHHIRPLDSTNNLYFFAGDAASWNVGPIKDRAPAYGDPQFVDPANGDYAMPAKSPAHTAIGFTSLPTDQGPLPRPTDSLVTP